ncbi:tryptophanyl-tRNA synthetase [Blastocladiella britannica]|nr:tryptophanyl-tRNA synthetase [Blastocladiella britannica]
MAARTVATRLASQSSKLTVRILSGIQPTGTPHLGNYLGAVRQWAKLQHDVTTTKDGDAVLYSIVDMHALTTPHPDPNSLRQSVLDTAAVLLAAGIDPKGCILFQQSHVLEHAALQWALTCGTSMGWVARMTQWKSKAGNPLHSDEIPEGLKMGLFSYPVLMAADILLYKATKIPVGEDQHQHLELTRLIARSFNKTYKTNVFPMPQAMTVPSAKRIMSLTNPLSKMSKSDPAPHSRIHLTDTDTAIAAALKRATTDSDPSITYDPSTRPGVANLLGIYASCRDIADPAALVAPGGELAGVQGHAKLKQHVTDVVVATVSPIRDEYLRLKQDPAVVQQVLQDGADRARELAQPTWKQVSQVMGMA